MSLRRSDEKSIESGEDWGSNVSLVSNHSSFSCFSITLRIFLGVVFLAAGVVAVVYSVTMSERKDAQYDENFFPYSVDQECSEGNLSVYTIVSDDGSETVFEVTSTKLVWIQDAQNKRLFYQFGVAPNIQYRLFVYETVAYNVSNDFTACSKVSGMNYQKFFAGLGLVDVPKKDHAEQLLIHGHITKVNAYEGEPPQDLLIDGEHPSLVFAYSNAKTDITYRWEIFFPRESSLSRKDYWFEDMKPRTEDASIFNDLPQKCLDL
ncbi:hypothetical protein PFISCL1PPCAC_6283 [Pristionchus fissidentatus]|uniref:Uncharacterized protein n=1 Tax=Pristionchus fissidentatus TaxID=1538716 RepID=A0AAV5V5W0_9BILA|nr:hypothetical protein PFISCL1PPCAC_6283 [Pristionchus fissidentatus]